MKKIFFIALIAFFCNESRAKAQFSDELLKVSKLLQGSFSSEKQAKNDSDFFDIRLKIIPIWKGRTDALWFYVEQAVASMQDKPYRQRVYRLTELIDGTFESAVYSLDNPLRFVNHLELVEALTPDSISLKQGCSVFLKKSGRKEYKGGTSESSCPSDMRGASYANSMVTLNSKMLLSWDRGFDSSGKQVWGAEKGGYIFRRLK